MHAGVAVRARHGEDSVAASRKSVGSGQEACSAPARIPKWGTGNPLKSWEIQALLRPQHHRRTKATALSFKSSTSWRGSRRRMNRHTLARATTPGERKCSTPVGVEWIVTPRSGAARTQERAGAQRLSASNGSSLACSAARGRRRRGAQRLPASEGSSPLALTCRGSPAKPYAQRLPASEGSSHSSASDLQFSRRSAQRLPASKGSSRSRPLPRSPMTSGAQRLPASEGSSPEYRNQRVHGQAVLNACRRRIVTSSKSRRWSRR